MKLYLKDREIDPWELHGPGFWYLGSPYTLFPEGIEAAYEEICRIAGWLIERGVKVFCPIAQSHAIATVAMLDPTDHDIWLPIDEPLMDAGRGLIVAEMKGWLDSYGLKKEQARFVAAGKPIVHLRSAL